MTMPDIADRFAVESVIVALGRWLDGQGGDPRDIYDADVVVVSPRGELRGFDQVVGFVQRADSAEHTQHMHTDLVVEVDGDEAVAHVNQYVHFYEPRSEPYRSAGGRARYGMVRRDAGWRISHIDMELTWLRGGLPAS